MNRALVSFCFQVKKGENKAPKVDLSPLFKPRKEPMLNRVAVSVGRRGWGGWEGGSVEEGRDARETI